MAFAPSRDQLVRMYPRALPGWMEALVKLAPELCEFYNFDRDEWCRFAGQMDAECDGFALKRMEENMRFTTTARILKVYSYRLGVAIKKVNSGEEKEPAIARGKTKAQLAACLRNNPKLLADIVYGGREGTPWMCGSQYIGRGPLQETHLNNYRANGEEIARQPGGGQYDLVKTPELLATDPELGIRSAFAGWKVKGLSQYKDVDVLSDALNTGNIRDNVKPHGLPRRREATKRARAIFVDQEIIVAAPKITAKDLKKNGSRTVTFTQRIKLTIKAVLSALGLYTVDDQSGLGVANSLISQGEQVKDIVARGTGLVSWLPPEKVTLIVLIGGALLFLYWLVHKLEWFRVDDARNGVNTANLEGKSA